MHTEKVADFLPQLVRSPNNKKYSSPYERTRTIDVREGDKEEKYSFLTEFEKEEILRY